MIRFSLCAFDGVVVGCAAAGNSTAQSQAAGTGRDHLPSTAADDGRQRILRTFARVWLYVLPQVCSMVGSGNDLDVSA